jgi:hypothetical protein
MLNKRERGGKVYNIKISERETRGGNVVRLLGNSTSRDCFIKEKFDILINRKEANEREKELGEIQKFPGLYGDVKSRGCAHRISAMLQT